MAGNKKLFIICNEQSVSGDSNFLESSFGFSSGACSSSQLFPQAVQVEPERSRRVSVGVQVPPNDEIAPLINDAEQPENLNNLRTQPEDPTTANDTTCCDKYTDWAEKVTDSWMMFVVLILLLGESVYFIFMGAMYYHQCPFYPHFPLMTIIMGASGSFATLMRMLRILNLCRSKAGHWCLRYLTNNGFFLFLVVFALELGLYVFSDGYPSRNIGEDTYCDYVFYDFLRASFAVVIVTVILSVVIYVPLVHKFFKPLYSSEQAANHVD